VLEGRKTLHNPIQSNPPNGNYDDFDSLRKAVAYENVKEGLERGNVYKHSCLVSQ